MLQTCLMIFTIPSVVAICQSATAAATATEVRSNIPLLNLQGPRYIYKRNKGKTQLGKE